MFCDTCQVNINSRFSGAHKRWCGHSKKVEKECLLCHNVFLTIGKRPSKFCSASCASKHSMNADVRKKISDSRKKWLKENPENHPWKKNTKFKSDPCERLKSFLEKEKIIFISEYQPLLHKEKFYSIDIAIPHLKIGIEINGEQHYNRDKSLKTYYKKRHEEIEKSGWLLLEYHYSFCYKDEKIYELIDSIKNQLKFAKYEFEFSKIEKKEKEKKKIEPGLSKYEEVFNQLDLKKLGWVQKASKALGVSHTHVRRVQKKFFSHLETYKRN
jgi:hypothetical protein